MNYVLKNEFCEATIASFGAELISFKANGRENIWQGGPKLWSDHAPILFPICGRTKDDLLIYKGKEYTSKGHGFAYRSEFKVLSNDDTNIVFELSSDENTKAVYPFDFRLLIKYSLEGKKLALSATVFNTGDDVLPYSFGWHPGFNLPTENGQDIEDYAIKFNGKDEVTWVKFYDEFEKLNDLIPYPTKNSEYKLCEEEIYKNDTMIFLNTGNAVRLEADGHPFKIDMTWSENLPVLCIWKSEKNEAKFICIEPWTHATVRGEKSNDLSYREAHHLNPNEKEEFLYTVQF